MMLIQFIWVKFLQAGSGQNPARQAAMSAGISKETTASTINQVCGSGLASVGYSL